MRAFRYSRGRDFWCWKSLDFCLIFRVSIWRCDCWLEQKFPLKNYFYYQFNKWFNLYYPLKFITISSFTVTIVQFRKLSSNNCKIKTSRHFFVTNEFIIIPFRPRKNVYTKKIYICKNWKKVTFLHTIFSVWNIKKFKLNILWFCMSYTASK